jgi:hypothetical protein
MSCGSVIGTELDPKAGQTPAVFQIFFQVRSADG